MEDDTKRRAVNKTKAAKKFNAQSRKTKSVNVQAGPMRGGWRL